MSEQWQPGEPDPAKVRFMVIQAMRAIGALLAAGGIAIASHRFPALATIPDAVGYVLLAAGIADFFVVPQVLARRWRSGRR